MVKNKFYFLFFAVNSNLSMVLRVCKRMVANGSVEKAGLAITLGIRRASSTLFQELVLFTIIYLSPYSTRCLFFPVNFSFPLLASTLLAVAVTGVGFSSVF